MTESKKNLISALRGGGWGSGGGEGGEGGDCGSGASIRISWVMVYRVQEVGKALKGVDYSLHCSSAFKSKIESTRIPSEKKNVHSGLYSRLG